MEQLITDFLHDKGWMEGNIQVHFLAAGEYNENYLVQNGLEPCVFRINRGSQLGLADQIGYEFKVLSCVESSRVTPRPLYVHSDPHLFGAGVMLMEHLPGTALDYERNWPQAARIFARIHSVVPCPELIRQPDPIAAITAESLAMLTKFPNHALKKEQTRLLQYHEEMCRLGQDSAKLFAADNPCVVNTEVNSGNFLITPESAYLVDWEKAVVSSRYQDLAHFLAPTTTLWKTETLYRTEQKHAFLTAYQSALDNSPDLEELTTCCKLMERVIVLRGLSWCHMAYHEYSNADRALCNAETWVKIQSYMREMDRFIAAVR